MTSNREAGASSSNAKPGPVNDEWGKLPQDHFGYASDKERREKRGLEDWELVNSIPESQRGVPWWFFATVGMVLLFAIGLSFPFWGDRPGFERSWFNWGFVAAIVYLLVAGAFIYFMVNFYGSRYVGRLDSDKEKKGQEDSATADRDEAGK